MPVGGRQDEFVASTLFLCFGNVHGIADKSAFSNVYLLMFASSTEESEKMNLLRRVKKVEIRGGKREKEKEAANPNG